jgi:hypothetical protein
MANASKYLGQIACYTNEKKLIKCEYDFSNDGGATGFIAIGEAAEDLVIHKMVAKVKTAVTTSASGTLAFGRSDSAAELMSAKAAGALLINTVVSGEVAVGTGIRVASGKILGFTIATGALTAGKVEVELEVTKF